MSETVQLSRDAQVVRIGLFYMGRPASVTFARPHVIHPRTLAALQELVEAGMIEQINPNKLPRGSMGWKATENIGEPYTEPRPDKSETWPVLTE